MLRALSRSQVKPGRHCARVGDPGMRSTHCRPGHSGEGWFRRHGAWRSRCLGECSLSAFSPLGRCLHVWTSIRWWLMEGALVGKTGFIPLACDVENGQPCTTTAVLCPGPCIRRFVTSPRARHLRIYSYSYTSVCAKHVTSYFLGLSEVWYPPLQGFELVRLERIDTPRASWNVGLLVPSLD